MVDAATTAAAACSAAILAAHLAASLARRSLVRALGDWRGCTTLWKTTSAMRSSNRCTMRNASTAELMSTYDTMALLCRVVVGLLGWGSRLGPAAAGLFVRVAVGVSSTTSLTF